MNAFGNPFDCLRHPGATQAFSCLTCHDVQRQKELADLRTQLAAVTKERDALLPVFPAHPKLKREDLDRIEHALGWEPSGRWPVPEHIHLWANAANDLLCRFEIATQQATKLRAEIVKFTASFDASTVSEAALRVALERTARWPRHRSNDNMPCWCDGDDDHVPHCLQAREALGR